MPVDLSAGIFLIQSRDLDSRQNGTLPGRSKLILAGRIPPSMCAVLGCPMPLTRFFFLRTPIKHPGQNKPH